MYMQYTQPLFVQAVMAFKTLYDSKVFKIHVLGQPAEGDLKRPFKVASLFGGMCICSRMSCLSLRASVQRLRARRGQTRPQLRRPRRRSLSRPRMSSHGAVVSLLGAVSSVLGVSTIYMLIEGPLSSRERWVRLLAQRDSNLRIPIKFTAASTLKHSLTHNCFPLGQTAYQENIFQVRRCGSYEIACMRLSVCVRT